MNEMQLLLEMRWHFLLLPDEPLPADLRVPFDAWMEKRTTEEERRQILERTTR